MVGTRKPTIHASVEAWWKPSSEYSVTGCSSSQELQYTGLTPLRIEHTTWLGVVKNILNKSKDTYLPFWKTSNLKSHIVPACCCCSRFRGTNQRRLNPMRIKTNTNNKKLSTTVFNAPVQFTPFRPQRAELTHTHTHTVATLHSPSPTPKDTHLQEVRCNT